MQYQVICGFDLVINQKMLNYVYLPILGRDCINLYNILIDEADCLKTLSSNISIEAQHLYKLLGVEKDGFECCRQKLEAIGLIQTYINQNKQDMMTFVILPTLNWAQFSQNEKLFQLFKASVNDLEFERLKFCFEGNNQIHGYLNVSNTFENIFKNVESKKFDFQRLYDELFKMIGTWIIISESTKVEINHLYNEGKITQSEIISLCYQSYYKDGDSAKVDEKIFRLKIGDILNKKYLLNFNHINKINHNVNLFLEDIDEFEMQNIIKNYHSLNSEQYLACIQKNPVDELELKLINKLRTSYQLPDFVINILIDYSILINNGRIEPLYLQKIAITINRKNIKDLKKIIEHLKKAAKCHFLNHNNDKWVDW